MTSPIKFYDRRSCAASFIHPSISSFSAPSFPFSKRFLGPSDTATRLPLSEPLSSCLFVFLLLRARPDRRRFSNRRQLDQPALRRTCFLCFSFTFKFPLLNKPLGGCRGFVFPWYSPRRLPKPRAWELRKTRK